MRIVAISDTHGLYPRMPDGDVLVHAGDATISGTQHEVEDFRVWLRLLESKFNYILFTPGNHDFCLEVIESEQQRHSERGFFSTSKVSVLINQSKTIDGVKFWMSPYSVQFGNWAYMKPDNELQEIWKQIPDDTDVLVTHTPPHGILDKNVANTHCGSWTLRNELLRVKPKAHIFGHIHEAYGQVAEFNTSYINASVVNEYYQLTDQPIILDI